MEIVSSTLRSVADDVIALGPQLVSATVVLLLFLALGHAMGEGVSRMVRMGRGRTGHSKVLNRGVKAGFGLVGLVLALQILGLTAIATSLLATGGLVAVILGFAFREIGENLLAGLFLGISRSFEVGDLIESSGHIGKVREIDLRQVWIRSADGRDIYIPSAQIFRSVLTNYTRDGLRRAEFVVGIDYADDAIAARDRLLAVTNSVDGVLAEPSAAVRISEFSSQYCELKVLFWLNIETGPGLSELRSNVMAECVQALKDGGFTLSSDVSTAISIAHEDDRKPT